MRYFIQTAALILLLAMPVYAQEYSAPPVPESGSMLMPAEMDMDQGLIQMIKRVIPMLRPDLSDALRVTVTLIIIAIVVDILQIMSGQIRFCSDFAGTAAVMAVLLQGAHSLIRLACETISQISEYGKLLLPVMTAALASQGNVTTSAGLHAGTALFSAFLGQVISEVFVPLVYVYLILGVCGGATGESSLKKMQNMIKQFISWCLKIILTVYTTYMSITGVISGTTDAAVLKATKVTISTVVPVVGSILSDASESILVSVALAKNAAGIYGIFAVLAVFLYPFMKIGIHYLFMKASAAICGLWESKCISGLIEDFSGAMGLLLAMTGSSCLMQLISTICYLRGVG